MNGATLVFATLAVVCTLLFVYPYVIYPLVLRFLPSHRGARDAHRGAPEGQSVALLFCAYNEAAVLPDKLRNLRMMKAELPGLEILAYSDCSSDATNELLAGAEDILTPVLGETRLGKVLGMQRLINMTDADVLVFTDANVIVDSGSLRRLVGYFDDSEIGSVAATLVYEEGGGDGDSVTARVGGLYWRLEESIKQQETRTGSMMGADGSFFARRGADYPSIPPDLVDDMAASLWVLFDGLRCISAPDVIGRESSVSSRSEEFCRKRRIACGSYSTYRFMRAKLRTLPWLDRFKFFSHKVTRWWGAFFLLGALLCTLAAMFAASFGVPGALVLAVLGGVFVVLGHYDFPRVAPLYEMTLAVLATGIGVLESLTGNSYATWDPAKSR